MLLQWRRGWVESAQGAKHFPSKNDGLSLDPQHLCEGQAGVVANHQPHNPGDGDRGSLPGRRLAIDTQTSPGFSKTLAVHIRWEETKEGT